MRPAIPLAIAASALALAFGCTETPDANEQVVIKEPDFSQFAGDSTNPGVHTFLEQRCGTLDCHGQPGRAFRLYSAGGLRLPNDAGIFPGSAPDTPEEIEARKGEVRYQIQVMRSIVAVLTDELNELERAHSQTGGDQTQPPTQS